MSVRSLLRLKDLEVLFAVLPVLVPSAAQLDELLRRSGGYIHPAAHCGGKGDPLIIYNKAGMRINMVDGRPLRGPAFYNGI